MRITWIQPEDLVGHALAAARLDGHDVTALTHRWAAAGGDPAPPPKGASGTEPSPALRRLANQLLDAVDALPAPPSEPDDLHAVTTGWAADPGLPTTTSFDRVHGAWLGRAAGCLLGKPVEGLPRQGIREILTATGRWPLAGYFTAAGLPDDVARRWPWNRRSAGTSLAENIDGMPEDDDLNYPLLALLLLERHGDALTADHVAAAWLDLLPAGRTFTAERVAYRNLLCGLTPPRTATVHNPFAEWIGAQIRTDLYGWTHPGDPYTAARLAWRDATVSHVRNGRYGAMFAAAMGAAAVTADDVGAVLDTGISVLPTGSRIATAVTRARRIAASEPDWETVLDALYRAHGHLHWVHTVNNAALVAAALEHGGGDFGRTICAVASAGWDTDSNGATVGGILGALTGAGGLPAQWTVPVGGRLRTSIPGLDRIDFDTLAERTLRLAGGTR